MIRSRLNILLAQKRMNKLEFAEFSGLNKNTISGIASDKKFPRVEVVDTLCEKLQCQPGDLFEYVPDEVDNNRPAEEKKEKDNSLFGFMKKGQKKKQ